MLHIYLRIKVAALNIVIIMNYLFVQVLITIHW